MGTSKTGRLIHYQTFLNNISLFLMEISVPKGIFCYQPVDSGLLQNNAVTAARWSSRRFQWAYHSFCGAQTSLTHCNDRRECYCASKCMHFRWETGEVTLAEIKNKTKHYRLALASSNISIGLSPALLHLGHIYTPNQVHCSDVWRSSHHPRAKTRSQINSISMVLGLKSLGPADCSWF